MFSVKFPLDFSRCIWCVMLFLLYFFHVFRSFTIDNSCSRYKCMFSLFRIAIMGKAIVIIMNLFSVSVEDVSVR